MFSRLVIFFLVFFYPVLSIASGNHPEAGGCPPEKPYFAICTHSFHSLEGWYSSNCYATPEEAQKDADEHARIYHKGNSRYTGVSKVRSSDYK
jgi:hypothetical protein